MGLVQKQLSKYYVKATVPRTQLAGTKHGRGGGAPSGPPQTKLRSSAYAGIFNLGNTCYVASALHALAATPALLAIARPNKLTITIES